MAEEANSQLANSSSTNVSSTNGSKNVVLISKNGNLPLHQVVRDQHGGVEDIREIS